jgi:hypothetical protein
VFKKRRQCRRVRFDPFWRGALFAKVKPPRSRGQRFSGGQDLSDEPALFGTQLHKHPHTQRKTIGRGAPIQRASVQIERRSLRFLGLSLHHYGYHLTEMLDHHWPAICR